MSIVDGANDPAFRNVRDVFAENFARRAELGAALSVIVGGRTVVDMWGGLADHRSRRPWSRDTMVLVFSSTKGATALCAHLLSARGALDLDAPVCRYWPEFAAAGKENVSVRMLLSHRAGLPAIERVMRREDLFGPEALAAALAAQAPAWEPDTAHGYHALTFGWLVGEIVRRASGKTLGRYFRDEIANPLGLDFWIGLPRPLHARVARLRMAPPASETPLLRAMRTPSSLIAKAFANPPGLLRASELDSPEVREAEIPAVNGISTARGLAGMYSDLASGHRMVGADAVLEMSRVESDGDDRVLLAHTRFSSGFMKSVDNRPADSVRMGPNEAAFGHVGAGGSIGMADPASGVAIGYVMNQLGHGVMLNERGQSLIDAVYENL